MTNNGTPSPSTPSWVMGQRQRRQRGYGRRFSGVTSATGPRTNRSFTAAWGGHENCRAGDTSPSAREAVSILDQSAHARLEGRRPRRGLPPSAVQFGGVDDSPGGIEVVLDDALDQSSHARLERRRSSRLDLIDEFEHMSQDRPAVKKKRSNDNPPRRPPLPRTVRAAKRGGGVNGREDGARGPAASSRLATAKADSNVMWESPEETANTHGSSSGSKCVFDFEGTTADGNNATTAINIASTNITKFNSSRGSQDKDATSQGDATARGGNVKRSKIASSNRSNSASATAASSSALFEENVHPNDATKAAQQAACGIRRSSRLAKNEAQGHAKSLVRAANQSMQWGRQSIFRGPCASEPSPISQRTRQKARSDKGPSSLSSSQQNSGRGQDKSTSAAASSPFIKTRARAKACTHKRSIASAKRGYAQEELSPQGSPSNDLRTASTPSFAPESPSTFASSAASAHHGNGACSDGSSGGNESFTSLARQGSGQHWAWHHQRSISLSAAAPETPVSRGGAHDRSFSCGVGDLDVADVVSFLSPVGGGDTSPGTRGSGSTSSRKRPVEFTSSPTLYEDEVVQTPGGLERTRPRWKPPTTPCTTPAIGAAISVESRRAFSESGGPTVILAPLEKSCSLRKSPSNACICLVGSDEDHALEEKRIDNARDRHSSDNDESMMSAESDEDSSNSCEEESAEEDDQTMQEMTDEEIFFAKSSYHDFKFLLRSLLKWSRSPCHGGTAAASMGLNTGCLVALPPDWTLEHRASFSRWVSMAFGFRVGSVGGVGCGSFLRCGDAEGRAVLEKMKRILHEHKAGRLVPPEDEPSAAVRGTSKPISRNSGAWAMSVGSVTKTPRPFLLSKKSPSLPCFISEFGVDLLTDDMKAKASLDERTPAKSHHAAVPRFMKSLIQKKSLPCLGIGSLAGDNGRLSGGGLGRPPRLSSEGAVNNASLIDQLHGVPGSSPRLPPYCPPQRLPEAAVAACRPGLGSRRRCSFERPPLQPGCLQPFESPHPRNSLVLDTPSSQLEIGLETPMPKQAENWGSRPILGKDWGVSVRCCDRTINACSRIFAKSWFTSDFYGNEDLSSKYGIALDVEDEDSLFALYDPDANLSSDTEFPFIHDESLDESPAVATSKTLARCDSVGSVGVSAMNLLDLEDKANSFSHSVGTSAIDLLDDKAKSFCQLPNLDRRRSQKLRKYTRMSLCVATAPDFVQTKFKQRFCRLSFTPKKKRERTLIKRIVEDDTVFLHVLSFLNEGELIHSASLVCTSWADVAAEALGNLMRLSVGCDPSMGDSTLYDCENEVDSVETQIVCMDYSSVAKSMERSWPYLMARFPWAMFLSDGSFKRVYKVWNDHCGIYEALSVMDVNEIDDSGNLELVGTELAVSVLLSSVARRNICPNFVITRGVFTCQHEPPAIFWGCKEHPAPSGFTYDSLTRRPKLCAPKPDDSGNYQYIRMELCQHGDTEDFIKKHPENMLSPLDCRNLLFQMAFALFVAADRFGLKHYDVKLLNFFLQSATDSSIPVREHPHVVLRYGVGSHVFRLRMHPSSAHIAKLADYGTSVMRTDTDGQPVSLGQFTTLENTPPDYLILGNAAEQGYGHDCFGLGLCMLHLFTGHAPYEEILEDVLCPENLKGKLRKIWRQKSHNVIRSVMFDNDENGTEVEDQTLYNTLYRYLVLFGIPENQFDSKNHGKVWNAINTTLLCPKGSRKKCPDTDVFNKDRKEFSLAVGSDERIAYARQRLLGMDGAMELLLSLVSFNPKERATSLDVINSKFMRDLIEDSNASYCQSDIVKSYTAYLANNRVSNK